MRILPNSEILERNRRGDSGSLNKYKIRSNAYKPLSSGASLFSFSSEMSMSVTDDVSCAYSLVLHGNNKVFYPKVRPASRENNIITINTILYFPCPSSPSPVDTSHFPLNTQLQTHTHSQHTLVLHASWRASPYLLYVAWIGHIPPYFTGT